MNLHFHSDQLKNRLMVKFSQVCTLKWAGVKLQFPYELSVLSVFWITSKSNQKYRLDVVSEVFSRSGSAKDKTHRGIMAFVLNLFLTSMTLYMVPESFVCPGGSPNDQIRYRKHSMTDTEWMHSFSTYRQEPPVQRPPPLIARSNITSELFTILCSFVFTYAEIKSNSGQYANVSCWGQHEMVWVCFKNNLFKWFRVDSFFWETITLYTVHFQI